MECWAVFWSPGTYTSGRTFCLTHTHTHTAPIVLHGGGQGSKGETATPFRLSLNFPKHPTTKHSATTTRTVVGELAYPAGNLRTVIISALRFV